ncbi:MAG: PKD domain-containing protein, partial [Chloroflexota bacterium]
AAAAGATVTFTDASPPAAQVLTQGWAVSGGIVQGGTIPAAFIVQFPQAGCYRVTLTAFFGDGARTDSHAIAVGGATCQ